MTAEFRTLPRSERPRAKNLAALRRTKIGPIFPSDPDRMVGMRGTVPTTGTEPDWPAHRRWRQRHRRIARASRRTNR